MSATYLIRNIHTIIITSYHHIGIIFLTETETVHHAFQVLSERFTKEELKRTTLVIVFIYMVNHWKY